MLDKGKCTLVKLSLASCRHNFASRSAGHHSILQGRNPFHQPKLIGLVTPLTTMVGGKKIFRNLVFYCTNYSFAVLYTAFLSFLVEQNNRL